MSHYMSTSWGDASKENKTNEGVLLFVKSIESYVEAL